MSSSLARSRGQSLLEVIVVVAVGVVVVSSLVFATISSLRNAQFAQNQTKATKLAQEGIEGVRSARNRSGRITGLHPLGLDDITWEDARLWTPTSITDTCTAPCYFILSSGEVLTFIQAGVQKIPDQATIPETPFKRVVILEDDINPSTSQASQNSKKVTVVVTWTDFTGDHQSRLTTVLRKL